MSINKQGIAPIIILVAIMVLGNLSLIALQNIPGSPFTRNLSQENKSDRSLNLSVSSTPLAYPTSTASPSAKPTARPFSFISVVDYLRIHPRPRLATPKPTATSTPTPNPQPQPTPTPIVTPTPSPAINEVTLSLSPRQGSFGRNCSFSVDVNLATLDYETEGTDVILKFDTSKINVSSITIGSIYFEYLGDSYNNSTGKVNISGLSALSKAFKGSGKFATVKFQVKDAASIGSTTVGFDFDPNNKSKTTDSNVIQRGGDGGDILSAVLDGSFIVTADNCS